MNLPLSLCVLTCILGGITRLSAQAPATPAPSSAQPRILIAYFSWGGNTREIASQIQAQVGGDLFEIKTVKPYPTDYHATTEVAKQEQETHARPQLVAAVKNLAAYDVVFLGYPNWWGTLPMPVFSFLEQNKLSGKTILPFCTHEGSALGYSMKDLRQLCPGASLREGLAIRGGRVRRAQEEVKAWLQENKIPLQSK